MKSTIGAAALLLILLVAACSGMGGTTFLHPEYNFGFIERVAVIPFENASQDQGAGLRATRFFVTELLAAQAFDVVEPGEVARVLEGMGLVRSADLTHEQILEIGRELEAQALFLGSVGESSSVRAGGRNVNVVTLNARLVETETGTTVWSSTQTESGSGLASVLFGTRPASTSEVTRRCVARAVGTLIR